MSLFNSSSLISIGILMLFLNMYGLFKGIETISSLWIAPNILEHDRERLEVAPYVLHIPLQIIIPICLLIIVIIQRKYKEFRVIIRVIFQTNARLYLNDFISGDF